MSTTPTANAVSPREPTLVSCGRSNLNRLRARLIAVLFLLVSLSPVMAQSVVVHPFGGQNLELGAAVAERAAQALTDLGLDVYGPEVAPTLIPPLVVTNGFLSPAVFLGDGGIDTPTGAELLRETLGVDLAVTGQLALQDSRMVLEMHLSVADRVDALVRLEAPDDEPERLATLVARAIARALDAPMPADVEPFELVGGFGAYAQAITLMGAGFVIEAQNVLRDAESLPAAGRALLADLDAAADTTGAHGDPVRAAVFSLAREDFLAAETIERFQRLRDVRGLPAASLWLGVLAASEGDEALAQASFAAAAEAYAYGVASRASWQQARLNEPVDLAELLDDTRVTADAAALLAVSVIANNAERVDVEKRALQRLSRVVPFFTYPFERLSFIAFDEDEPLAAAEALVVAVELEPESDLYWTNLGWAYYLLGFLERSELASERALQLDASQFIARYNLGLAHAVRNDLDAALPEYERALQFDPEVDDAAIEDLERARELYPNAPAVHYALAFLYAAEGRRAEAADQYAAYLRSAEAQGTLPARFEDRARRQLEALQAPPAPLEISRGAYVVLGASDVEASSYHPGDPLTPIFELYTPGDALPQRVAILLEVLAADGEPVTSAEAEVSIPTGAIGYVVDNLRVELPVDVPAGSYRFAIRAQASEGRNAVAEIDILVDGEPQALRRLLGRGVVMTALETGTPLYGPRDLERADRLPEILVDELRSSADAAAGAIPVVPEGPFEGLDGGELFRTATVADVQAFLSYLLGTGVTDTSLVFVDAFAQWALEGAPAP